MPFSHVLAQTTVVESTSITASKTYEGSLRVSIAETIAIAASNFLVACTLDVSAIKSIRIQSDQDLTFETNSGGSPVDTIALKAGVPYVWNTDSYDACLLGTDVTALYLTNASGVAAAFKLEAIVDATP